MIYEFKEELTCELNEAAELHRLMQCQSDRHFAKVWGKWEKRKQQYKMSLGELNTMEYIPEEIEDGPRLNETEDSRKRLSKVSSTGI